MLPLPPFLHLLMTNVYMGSYCFFVAVNLTAVNILGHLSVWAYVSISLRFNFTKIILTLFLTLFHSYFYISFLGLYLSVIHIT